MQADLSKLIADAHLTPAEATVLRAIAGHGAETRSLGVRAIAAECFTSTSTVMRLARKLGYDGFIDMCYQLPLRLGGGKDAGRSLPFHLDLDVSPQNREAIASAARRMRRVGGSVHIYGCGYSSLMAQYLSKKLLGLGVRVIYSSADDSISIFENNLDRTDSLIVVTRSGRTSRVLKRVCMAADEGICTIAFTGNHESPIRQECDITIVADDEDALDDRNTEPSFFFARLLVLIELLVREYLEQEAVQ
ncbi:MurR/RpiR family transcriptional regulator [Collinsella vaginalis]|uniref:MurR/RpiR family transcriptional regulator n=1 Tax=Collinsella vaginalis TaxID=1870987 RepID=UPI000A270AA5|nr:MurR/RpiR family transcriptional regulator [Collinsella vaginalis]